jgi:hypothetical protein
MSGDVSLGGSTGGLDFRLGVSSGKFGFSDLPRRMFLRVVRKLQFRQFSEIAIV